MDLGPLLKLKTEIEKAGGLNILVLQFVGKITSDNIFDLNSRIRQLFEEGIYHCILDISELEYINSTGIALLLTIARTVEQNEGKLMLTRPTSFVKDLLDMTDLDSRFDIVKDVKTAKGVFEKAQPSGKISGE